MRLRLKYLIKKCSLLFCIFFLSAIGQEVAAQKLPEVWDLNTCINYAVKNNITLNNLRLNASSSEQNLILAKNARYPNLNANITEGLSYNDQSFISTSSYGINSSMVLYNGGYFTNDIKSNNLSWQASNMDVKAAENNITLQITQSYLNILLANENITYLKDVVSTSELQVSQYQEKYKLGAVALKDLMQLQSTLAADKYSLVAAENAKRQNILALKKLLQLPADVNFDISTLDNAITEITIFPLEEVQNTALQNMPEIKSSELLVKKQHVELLKSKSGYLPSLTLNGGISTGFSSVNTNSYFTQLENNYTPQVGLTLSIPILNRKSTRINVTKSKIILEQTKLAFDNTKTELLQTIEQAYINVQNTQSQHIAAEEQLKYAKESYRISCEQLKIGANNNVEFLQQKNQYLQAIQMYTQAKYSLILYVKIYNFYKGIPVTD